MEFPPAYQPRPATTASISIACFSSVVGLPSIIPPEETPFSADTLGTERAGTGVVIATAGADERLSDYRGGSRWLHLATAGGGKARTRRRFRERPLAWWQPWSLSIAIRCRWLLSRCRLATASWWAAPAGPHHAVGCQPDRSKAGMRRLLEYRAGQAIFTHPAQSQLGSGPD